MMWERYALLNNIYGKVYNYETNIKPAPSPFYTLDKYYGNLTIQEYRKLLKNDTLLFGRESSGVPDKLHKSIKYKIKIPMIENKRSLNLATSAAIIISESLRQILY